MEGPVTGNHFHLATSSCMDVVGGHSRKVLALHTMKVRKVMGSERELASNMTPAYLEGGLESPRTTSDNFGEGPDPPGMSFEPIRGGLKPFPCRPPYRNPLLLVADLSKAHEKGFFWHLSPKNLFTLVNIMANVKK